MFSFSEGCDIVSFCFNLVNNIFLYGEFAGQFVTVPT